MKENIRRAILQDQDIYLCVPMRDRLDYKVPENQKRAERYAADIMERYDCKVIAPQAYLPNLLDPDDPAQYQLSLRFRGELMKYCSVLLVCGEAFTEEMEEEILMAVETGLLIVSMPESEAAVHGFLMQTNLDREVLLGRALAEAGFGSQFSDCDVTEPADAKRNAWRAECLALLDALQPDDALIVVDCHI